ncbi:hypothetical protein CONPUDRAFT_148300 [Coniophora puteana RWD-64-598 SS2]|uniref:Uncharacterized protein n=1 Tax=Coniophora puteana (strain RWD-64-598) TaxID=741705 RepID=A0A5M3N444_CONPW|nr:uncharacterized protein CONPUDRAFT_148300 [Coniophora puteana RWD-64-598 SS2]EIW86202.1 hypothetical protein CONPUDRAFT_148300 [Coniophora puteana RWD-64-598 SS2]
MFMRFRGGAIGHDLPPYWNRKLLDAAAAIPEAEEYELPTDSGQDSDNEEGDSDEETDGHESGDTSDEEGDTAELAEAETAAPGIRISTVFIVR